VSDPRPNGVEKIQGHSKFYKVKIGRDFRLSYRILQERLIIVLVIRDHKEAYRALDILDDRLESALGNVQRFAPR
jgi:mRNA-degrading endonuclease RelE of RelBE toxin-antitoxin system